MKSPCLFQAVGEAEPLPVAETLQPCVPIIPQPQEAEEPAFPCALIQSTEFDSAAADDEFVPGSMCKCVWYRGACRECFLACLPVCNATPLCSHAE